MSGLIVRTARDLFTMKKAHAMPRRDGMQDMLDWAAGGTVTGSFRLTIPFAMPNAQVANAELFSLRWTSTTQDMVVEYMDVRVVQSAAAASAQTQGDVRVFYCVSYTVADSAGTVITPQRKNRVSMNPSNVADFRYANGVAAGLTVGTRTLSPQPILGTPYLLMATAPDIGRTFTDEWDASSGAIYPLVLSAANAPEGIIVRSTAAHPATGAASATFTIDWTEIPAGSLRV